MPKRRILSLPLRSESPSLMWVIMRLPEIENGALPSLADKGGEYKNIASPIRSTFETAVSGRHLKLKNLRYWIMREILIMLLQKSKSNMHSGKFVVRVVNGNYACQLVRGVS